MIIAEYGGKSIAVFIQFTHNDSHIPPAVTFIAGAADHLPGQRFHLAAAIRGRRKGQAGNFSVVGYGRVAVQFLFQMSQLRVSSKTRQKAFSQDNLLHGNPAPVRKLLQLPAGKRRRIKGVQLVQNFLRKTEAVQRGGNRHPAAASQEAFQHRIFLICKTVKPVHPDFSPCNINRAGQQLRQQVQVIFCIYIKPGQLLFRLLQDKQ